MCVCVCVHTHLDATRCPREVEVDLPRLCVGDKVLEVLAALKGEDDRLERGGDAQVPASERGLVLEHVRDAKVRNVLAWLAIPLWV